MAARLELQLSPAGKARLVGGIVLLIALWPIAHRQLVTRLDVNPWKLYGFAMYCTPHEVVVDVIDRSGDRPLRILAAEAISGASDDAPGTARLDDDGSLRIATGDGWLAPRVLQRPGGRALEVRDFQRGRPISDGARL